MGPRRWSAYWWLLAGGIALLAWLGALQYRWIRRAGEAELQERRQFLRNALGGVRAGMLDRLRKPLATLRPDRTLSGGTDYASLFASRFERWQKEGGDPGLSGGVMLGWIERNGKVACSRMRAGDKSFSAAAWTAGLTYYRADLERRVRFQGGGPPFIPEGNAWARNDSKLVLVFPLTEAPREGRGRRGAPTPSGPRSMPPQRPAPPEVRGWVFLEIEDAFLERLLPDLVRRYFGQAGVDNYRVALVSGQPPQLMLQSGTQDSNWISAGRPDEEMPLFTPPRPELPSAQPVEDEFGRRPPQAGFGGRLLPEPPDWRLVAQHKAGSLEEVVLRIRRQSFTFSVGALLLLLAAGTLLVLSTHRARLLARQQMEFVAGVSHELRTPLTVIQTTSYNLAQGKLNDWRRVKQYGEAIQREVRRLTIQVEQMLSFAGIESGRKLYDLQPVNVAEVIDRALGEYAPAFEAQGWQIENEAGAGLPTALADERGLETALKNLLQNALKYADGGKWLGISARSAEARGRAEIQVTVSDRGPGIDPEDLPHIFEPFYRGRRKVASSETPGVGLGLCLVRRHLQAMGGNVTVESGNGRGAAFTLHLPVCPEANHKDRKEPLRDT